MGNTCGNEDGLYFVFTELSRKEKPCIDLNNISDALLFVDVMNFTKKNCIKLDGRCSSRVHTSMAYLSGILNPPAPCEPTINIKALLKDALEGNCGGRNDCDDCD